MACRNTSRAFIRLCAQAPQRLTPGFRQAHALRHRYIYDIYSQNMYYVQKRNIFWNEKKQEAQGAQGAQGGQEKQSENKNQSSDSDAEAETKKTQQKQQEQQKTNKAETQTKQQQSKEQTLAQQFESLLAQTNPELSSKLNTLWSKLQKEKEVAQVQSAKYKDEADSLDKAVKDFKGKIDILRGRVEEEINERELMRKRFEKEVAQSKVYAITKFAQDLIEVPDNLSRALESAKNLHGKGDNLYDGVSSTYHILQKTFEKHGIKQLNPVGERFDPNVHEALFDMENPAARPGTVGYVANVGYKIFDRTLRPAKVGVVRGDYVETAEEKAEREAKEKEKQKTA